MSHKAVYSALSPSWQQALERKINKLGEHVLTLNAVKSRFGMDKLTFVGTVLSGNGVSCAAEKVETITSAREPQNTSETFTFVGRMNNCGQFIALILVLQRKLWIFFTTKFEFMRQSRLSKQISTEMNHWVALTSC